MKIKSIRSKCNTILRKLAIDPETIIYISNYIVHCNDNAISDLDVNINALYRINVSKYDEAHSTLKNKVIEGLNRAYINNSELFIEKFGYKGKITLKKLVILILRSLRSEIE